MHQRGGSTEESQSHTFILSETLVFADYGCLFAASLSGHPLRLVSLWFKSTVHGCKPKHRKSGPLLRLSPSQFLVATLQLERRVMKHTAPGTSRGTMVLMAHAEPVMPRYHAQTSRWPIIVAVF